MYRDTPVKSVLLASLQVHNAHLHIKHSAEEGRVFNFESPAPHEEEVHIKYVLSERLTAQPALPSTGFPGPALRAAPEQPLSYP